MRTALLLILAGGMLGAPARYVEVSARYQAPKHAGENGAIAVRLVPTTEGVHVNDTPAPRLRLDADQKVLVDRQKPEKKSVEVPADPALALFLDPEIPVRFPVSLAAGAPSGEQLVSARVTYFYCSQTQGWCRKSTDDIRVAVDVP
jgi:hypothetical protein